MGTSVESKLSLALAVKLKEIFEGTKSDTFLVFPQGISFTYDYLSFMKPPDESGLSAVAQHNSRCDFARIMNVSFEDNPNFSPDSSVFLWDKFIQVLKDSVFPDSTLTVGEEDQLAEATQFLTEKKTDLAGKQFLVPSSKYLDYIKYKTIYDNVVYIYLDEKITIENTTDSESDKRKNDWLIFREKQLLDQIEKAKNDWINLGYKAQIENYSAIKNSLEQKKYTSLIYSEYMSDLSFSDLADLNAGGSSVKVTNFSPIDILDQSAHWISLNLKDDEIDNLVNKATTELRAIFPPDKGSKIKSVSFEYNNISIVRSWWKPEYFMSNYWKLSNSSSINVVSDGSIPNKGYIPAYISNVIVARNLKVIRKKKIFFDQIAIPILMKTKLPNVFKDFVISKFGSNSNNQNYERDVDISYTFEELMGEDRLIEEKYTFNGVVVLAYICKRIPKSPNPDFSLKWV